MNWFDWDGVWLDWPNWKQWGDWGSDWSDFCSNARSCHAGCCAVEVNADFDRGTCKLRVGVIAAFCLQGGYNSNHCGNTMCGRASVYAIALAVSGSWVGCQGNWDCGYWCPGINEEMRRWSVPCPQTGVVIPSKPMQKVVVPVAFYPLMNVRFLAR